MNQYAGTLFVCVCLGAVAAVGAGCDSATDASTGGASDAAGTSSSVGGTSSSAGTTSSSAGTTSSSAGTTSAGGGSATGSEVALASDPTGYVDLPTLGIMGAWYSYGDGIGSDGKTATGNCEAKGMHMVSECSNITTPTFGSFANMNSSMCTAGTVAKVINLVGMTGCPATSTACDYSNIFGAGIGLDLNNAGGDAGTGKMPYDAAAAGVIGFAFDIDTVPLAGIRVEFPTPATTDTSGIWKPAGSAANYVSPVKAGHNVILFTDITQPDYVKPPMAFDPKSILSVQFHVPTATSGSAMYSFCISNFSAVTTATGTVSTM